MILQAQNLGLDYGQQPVFREINLDIKTGEIIALVGPSGAGKSSLLRCLAGLQIATQGGLFFQQRPLRQPQPTLAMAFQEAALLPWLTVAQNVAFGLQFKHQPRLNRLQQQQRIDTALAQVDLTTASQLYPQQLSGGMAQRVALARCLARQPEVLLLDEPFGALDEATRLEMQDLLLRLHNQLHCTIVLVTHDLNEAIRLAHRIVLISKTVAQSQTMWTVAEAAKQNQSAAALQLHQQISRALSANPINEIALCSA